VRFVNDSKATTPEAAAAGLASYGRGLTLIAGGTDKGMDFTPFARAAHERAARVLLIGRTRERLREWIEGAARDAGGAPPPIRLCETLEEAVSSAARETPPGQVVLFSPACASYDMFLSFEERGERFRAAVRALPA
jgi:UDP-N-acetylmuramoylalanine--D-glutamate ligase